MSDVELVDGGVTQESSEITDAQMDKYFESRGEEGLSEAPAAAPEPADTEAPEPTETPIEQEVEPEQPPPQKTVPLGALHEAREKNRALQAQLHEQMEARRRIEERLDKIFALQNPVEKAVEYSDDPIEALKQKAEALERSVQEQKQVMEAAKQQNEQYAAYQRFVGQYKQSADAYAAENPDFYDAYNHLVARKSSEYRELGYSPAEVNQLIANDELSIAARSYQDEVNPAERVYRLAVLNGYRKAPPEMPVVNPAQSKLQTLQKGVAQKSLGSTSGKAPRGSTTLDELNHMSDEEFDKQDWSKIWK